MQFNIETEEEEDGRWIAAVLEMPGTQVYGTTLELAIRNVQDLAQRVIAKRLKHSEPLEIVICDA